MPILFTLIYMQFLGQVDFSMSEKRRFDSESEIQKFPQNQDAYLLFFCYDAIA